MKVDKFLVCGSGGSGTSLLRGLLNAHSKLNILFEDMGHGAWLSKAEATIKRGLIWGNKINVQKCNSNKINDAAIENFIKDFPMIWIVRRPRHFDEKLGQKYRETWHRINVIYWNIKDRCPDKIISVSFEDLVLWPEQELKRICSFLGIEYEKGMLEGTKNTGHGQYKYGKFLTEKAYK